MGDGLRLVGRAAAGALQDGVVVEFEQAVDVLAPVIERKRRPTPVLTPQTFSLSKRSFTADKSKCPGSKSSPHHARIS